MIRAAGNNSDFDAVFRIPPCKTMGDVKSVTNIQVIDCPFPDNQKSVFIDPDIDIAPPYVVNEIWSGNDSLVFRTSSCFFLKKKRSVPLYPIPQNLFRIKVLFHTKWRDLRYEE